MFSQLDSGRQFRPVRHPERCTLFSYNLGAVDVSRSGENLFGIKPAPDVDFAKLHREAQAEKRKKRLERQRDQDVIKRRKDEARRNRELKAEQSRQSKIDREREERWRIECEQREIEAEKRARWAKVAEESARQTSLDEARNVDAHWEKRWKAIQRCYPRVRLFADRIGKPFETVEALHSYLTALETFLAEDYVKNQKVPV